MFTDESCHPHNSLSVYVCVCAFGAMDQMTYFCFILFFFFFQIYILVLFSSLDLLRACFFVNHLGRGQFMLIYQM